MLIQVENMFLAHFLVLNLRVVSENYNFAFETILTSTQGQSKVIKYGEQ